MVKSMIDKDLVYLFKWNVARIVSYAGHSFVELRHVLDPIYDIICNTAFGVVFRAATPVRLHYVVVHKS